MQQLPFIKRLKCTHAYGGWSIFKEKCTPDVTFTPIRNPYRNPYMSKCILLPKMKRSIVVNTQDLGETSIITGSFSVLINDSNTHAHYIKYNYTNLLKYMITTSHIVTYIIYLTADC